MHTLLQEYQADWDAIKQHYQSTLKSLRSNRAHPSMIEDMRVMYYGTPTPLQQIGTITAPEPRQLVVEPWDKQALKDIEAAVNDSDTGFSVQNDGSVLRLTLPAMNEETRKQTVGVLHKRTEEARVGIRKVREDVLKKAKKQKDDGEMPEDEFFKLQKELQDHIDALNEDIKNISEAKEKEILSI